MALPGALPFLRDWASPQRAADLVVVDPTGFIAPAGGVPLVVAAEDIVGDLYRSLRENVRVEIDVVRGTLRVWLQGTDVVASNGLDQALATTPAVSLDGEPFFEATFEELQGAVAYLCDPDGGTACLAYPLLGGCPVPPPCDGLAGIREALPAMVRGLTLTFLGDCPPWLAERCGSRWYYPTPGTPPILRMYYTVTVDLDVDDDALAAEVAEEYRGLWDALRRYGTAELRFTDAGSEVLLAVEPETPGCEAGTCAAGTNGDRWMEWTSFLPGEPTTSWHSGNLRFRQVESSGASPAGHCSFRVEVESWIIDYLGVLFGVSSSMIQHGINEAIRPQRDEMCDRVALALDQLESALLGYVGMIPAADGPVLPFGEDTFRSLLAADVIDPVTARLLEGSAGASRGWWNAWTGPLTEWNEMAGGGQQFAFRDVDYSTAGGPLQVALDIRSDIDCDGWEDHRDGCPRFCQPSPSDLDGDTIWDACDLCPTDREPGRVAAWSERIDYIRAPGSRTRSTHDGDGDEVGDRCDLCPSMSIFDPPGFGRAEDEAWIPLAGGPSMGVGRLGPHPRDGDRDGVGDRCDNCPNHPNRDQWNCNWRDELLRGSLAEPPAPGHAGLGDVCDPYPCIDSCAAPYEQPELRVGRDESSLGRPYFPTAELAICPVGKDPDDDSAVGRIDTRVRGCYCSEGERLLGRCNLDICPNDGTMGEHAAGEPGWQDASYPAVPRDPATGDILPTTYDYKRLYMDEEWRGLTGERLGLSGYASYYEPAGRKTLQTWNWRDDVCGSSSADWEGCEKYVQMWFKPQATTTSWFDGVRYGPYIDREGNTYTDRLVWVDADGVPTPSGLPDFRESPFGGGGGSATGLTIPWLVDDLGRISRNTGTLVDILRVRCFAMGGPCPWWPDRLFFDEMGSEVAGVAVSSWSTVSDSVGWTIGSRLPPGLAFDVLEPSVAVTHDLNGDPYRYWMFGGVDAGSGEATDQMWGARLATIDGSGAVVYDDGSGLAFPLRNAAPPDPATTFFDLAALSRTNIWPSPRVGAALACAGTNVAPAGPGTAIEQACNGLCPKLDVVLGLNDPPDGVTQPAGALILVGGEGPDGLLDDIWRYEEVATWQPPSDVPIGDTGPWPSGWRLTGVLPEVAGGLSGAATVQVGRSLWLVGGRTDAGPTSDVYRVDLDIGTAARVEAAGSSPGPARVGAAVTYDIGRERFILFGGIDAANVSHSDLWAFDPGLGEWSQLVPECTGNGCPPATGREKLVLSEIEGRPTVIADRGTSVPATASWTLSEGAWVAAGERTIGVARIDCDGDTAIEARFGLRCSIGSDGFPDYGRLRCEGAGLGCRAPMLPGQIVHEYRMPHVRAMAAHGEELLALQGTGIDVYRLGSDGALTFERSLRLSRAAHDLAAVGNTLLVADGRGVSLLRANDGGLLSELEFCGRVRRVFAQGSRAYVVGLFQVMMIDISDPTDPIVLQRIGLLPDRDGGLRAYSTADCGGVDALLDRLCDTTGACGAFGRAAAAYEGGRLFLHLFGTLHVLALREDLGADVLASLPVGLLTDLAVDGAFVYGNGPGHRTMVIGEAADGSWVSAGEHDVTGWVSGVVEVGPWVVRADRGRLQVATRR